jgi:signal transduction histidine kinase
MANLAEWITEDLGISASDAAKENLSLLRKRATHMEALINGILEYSRAGRRTETPETVDLQEMVAEILQLIAPPPDRYTIRIPERLPVLRAPRMTFERIWTNLLSNAVKFSHPSGAIIDVTVRVDRGTYEFCVADNGIGLSERDLQRVFTLFHRVTARHGAEGMGIGLAVVKKLVDNLGGRVWVESVLGGGSRFYFTFPAAGPRSGADDVHARATT